VFWELKGYRYLLYHTIITHLLRGKSGLILDAGCGKGSKEYLDFSVGIDISKKNVRLAKKKKSGADFVVADIEHLPFRNRIFNCVVSIDVLEHLYNKNASIAELSRVIALRGSFIGSTSNLLNPILFFDSKAPRSIVKVLTDRYAKGHYNRHSRLTPKTLHNILRKNGLTPSLYIVGFPPFNPWLYLNPAVKPPWFSIVWVLFDRITKHAPLLYLKEMMVFSGTVEQACNCMENH
jgi:SAM-dependent methyltransferase